MDTPNYIAGDIIVGVWVTVWPILYLLGVLLGVYCLMQGVDAVRDLLDRRRRRKEGNWY